MEIHLFLSGRVEEYLKAVFQKISELEEKELSNEEGVSLLIDILEKGVEAKWVELSGLDQEDLGDLGGLEENTWYTFFGDPIEIDKYNC